MCVLDRCFALNSEKKEQSLRKLRKHRKTVFSKGRDVSDPKIHHPPPPVSSSGGTTSVGQKFLESSSAQAGGKCYEESRADEADKR